jgi:hypothetical protein
MQQTIQFEKATPVDNRKTGVAFICFDDQLMNYSSNLKFATPTSNWRKIQKIFKLGDYGGSFDPEQLQACIDEVKSEISFKYLSDPDCMDAIYKKTYDVDNATIIFEKLEKIIEAAKAANTRIKIMTADYICML